MPHAHQVACESLAVSVGLIIVALIYTRGWLRARRLDSNTNGAWRVVTFLLGLFLIWTAIGSPVGGLDHTLLTAHMIKHLLLMTLAPPLILLGAPLELFSLGLPRRSVLLLGRLFNFSPVQQFARTLTHPAVCWLGSASILVGWHVPNVFMLGCQSEILHALQQASFLVTGILFWVPVVKSRPLASKGSEWSLLLYLFLATLPCDILSGFLVFCDRVVYPFRFPERLFGLTALEDQQCAGALMWTCVTLVYLVAAALITARLLSPQRLQEHSIPQPDPAGSAGAMAQQTVEVS